MPLLLKPTFFVAFSETFSREEVQTERRRKAEAEAGAVGPEVVLEVEEDRGQGEEERRLGQV